jgi:rhomboid family GlyGly-CTERM serine protease
MGLRQVRKVAERHPFLLVGTVLALVAVVLQAGGAGVRETLAYQRAGIDAGQLWRLVTGHLVHLGWSHLAYNLAGLVLIGWLVGRAFDAWRWAGIVAASIIVINIGFRILNPALEWYVGMSGVLHGVLAGGVLAGVLARDREAFVLAVIIAGKLAWEQWAGPIPGSESASGGPVVVDAHLYGAVGGLLSALWLRRRVPPRASI